MFLPFVKPHVFLKVSLALALMTGALHAAPYGPEGRATVWTQPDGTKLSLRVFGDEFYAHTETDDGYTVVLDRETKTYHSVDLLTTPSQRSADRNLRDLGNRKILPQAHLIKQNQNLDITFIQNHQPLLQKKYCAAQKMLPRTHEHPLPATAALPSLIACPLVLKLDCI